MQATPALIGTVNLAENASYEELLCLLYLFPNLRAASLMVSPGGVLALAGAYPDY